VGFPKRIHDPDARLDYPFDWSDWLPEGDSIESATVTAEAGVTVDGTPTIVGGTKVVPYILGGTVGQTYDVTCHIVTADGREDDRSITLVVKEK
jgi:hypothetical protein